MFPTGQGRSPQAAPPPNPLAAMAESIGGKIQAAAQEASNRRHEQLLLVLGEILAELKKLSEGA